MAQGSVSTRSLFLALAVGAIPAALTLLWATNLFQPSDLPIAAGACALFLILGFLPARFVALSERSILLFAVLVAAAPAVLSNWRLASPVTNDDRAYLLQAELFSEGRTSESIPQPAKAWRMRQVFEDDSEGIRYAKYPPGTSLALTPAVAVGQPWLAALFAGVLDVLLLWAIARRLGLQRAAFAPLLLVASPFFLLVQTSVQSEIFTFPAVTGSATHPVTAVPVVSP